MASADAVLFVIDAAAGGHDPEAALLAEVAALNARAPRLLLANKADLPVDLAALTDRFGGGVLPISATTGRSLDRLAAALAATLADLAAPQPAGLLLHDRQRRQIAAAAEAAGRAAGLLGGAEHVIDVAELAAVELRAALEGLAGLTGEVVTEDILARIFARFCVGK